MWRRWAVLRRYYTVQFVLGFLFWGYALIGVFVCPWTDAGPEDFAGTGFAGAGLMALAAYSRAGEEVSR